MKDNRGCSMYATGDCHREYSRFNTRNFPEQKEMTKEDFVLVCGDFGFWEESRQQEHDLDAFEKRSFTTLWIDGNHENFDLLKQYPIQEWHGGKVQFLRPSVIRLMRGQVYEICGRKLFTFGGASSHDCEVILRMNDPDLKKKEKRLKKQEISYRIEGLNWWKEELPSEEELEEGFRNLEKHGWNVDFIFTHCCPDQILDQNFPPDYKKDMLTEYLEQIRRKCGYKKWVFGHYHCNRNIDRKTIAIYEQIIRIF